MILKTLYEILGVPADATEAQIKRAYRKLAKRLHPDHGGKEPEKFREATNAYEVLSDAERRRRYDETGQGGDPAKTDAVQNRVMALSQIILQAIQQNPQGCNPVAVSRQIIQAKILQLRNTAQMDRDQAARLRHMASNVIRRGEGDNVIASVLENHSAGGEAHASQLCGEADSLAEVLAMLDDYGWTPDNQRGVSNYHKMQDLRWKVLG